jgi:NTP pyrophosphatase (non-canonical NTP hydrolase)
MQFSEYQVRSQACRLVSTQDIDTTYVYPLLGLAGEVGEIHEKFKKVLRDDLLLDDERRNDFKKELGDVLWYVTALGEDFGFSLEDIARGNIEKLESRAQRGKISGSGDNR